MKELVREVQDYQEEYREDRREQQEHRNTVEEYFRQMRYEQVRNLILGNCDLIQSHSNSRHLTSTTPAGVAP